MDYSKCSLFKNLTDKEIDKLISKYGEFATYEKDEYVFLQEELPEYMYVLVSGSVCINKFDVSGKRTILNIFNEPGTLFGEVYPFLDKKEYDYSCIALKNTEILKIKKSFFNEIYHSEDNFAYNLIYNLLRILSEKAYYLNQKMIVMSGFTIRQKIAHFLLQKTKEYSEIKLNLNREDFADYLGTTRPSLSRELSKMEIEGLLKISKNHIDILDIQKLKNLL